MADGGAERADRNWLGSTGSLKRLDRASLVRLC